MSKYYYEGEIPSKRNLSGHMHRQFIGYEKLNTMIYLDKKINGIRLSNEMLDIVNQQFHKVAGNYSVMTDIDTIKGMYKFMSENEDLTPAAIDALWPKYIKDLFEEYKLEEKYQELTRIFGKEDSTYCMFLTYVDIKGKELQQKYEQEALKLSELSGQYSEKFIKYLRSLILRKHIQYADILKNLPESTIIAQDESDLRDISIYHRIDFGLCNPISYTMVEELIKNGNLDEFDEQPKYIISTSEKEYPTSFTKSDFLKSIKEKEIVK